MFKSEHNPDPPTADASKVDSSIKARKQKILRQYLLDHFPFHIRQSERSSLEFIRESFVIETQLV